MHRCQSIITTPSDARFQVAWVGHTRVHGGDPTLIDDIIKAGKELEMEGVRAICGA